jgi:hypothetical protein
MWVVDATIDYATGTGALKIAKEVLGSFEMSLSVVRHEPGEFADSVGNVRSGAGG